MVRFLGLGLTATVSDGREVEELAGGLERAAIAGEERLVEVVEVGDHHGAVDPPAGEAIDCVEPMEPSGCRVIAGAVAWLAVPDTVAHPLRHFLEAIGHSAAVETSGIEDAETISH